MWGRKRQADVCFREYRSRGLKFVLWTRWTVYTLCYFGCAWCWWLWPGWSEFPYSAPNKASWNALLNRGYSVPKSSRVSSKKLGNGFCKNFLYFTCCSFLNHSVFLGIFWVQCPNSWTCADQIFNKHAFWVKHIKRKNMYNNFEGQPLLLLIHNNNWFWCPVFVLWR